MKRIDEELRAGATILALVDRRRAETGDPALGSAIERAILDRCLADLERDLIANPMPCPAAARTTPPARPSASAPDYSG